MISLKVISLLVVSQFTRSRVDGPASQCLWWVENTDIVYQQSTLGNDETPGETEFAATKSAYETWNNQMLTCGSLKLTEGARSTSREAGYFENKPNVNLVLFRQRECSDVAPKNDPCFNDDNCGNVYDCWQHAPGAIAITTTSYDKETGRILDSDIELNTPNFIFSTVDAPPCLVGNFSTLCIATDIQNTLTHEVGHLLGLAHTNVSGSTMAPSAPGGEISKRTLDSFSKQFVCEVYPKSKPSRTCFLKSVSVVAGKTSGCSATSMPFLVAIGAWAASRRKRRLSTC